MEYELQVRLVRYEDSLDATGNPEEVEVYKTTRTIHDDQGENVDIFDKMDDVKMSAMLAIEQDILEEDQDISEWCVPNEPDEGKRAYYSEKYGDAR